MSRSLTRSLAGRRGLGVVGASGPLPQTLAAQWSLVAAATGALVVGILAPSQAGRQVAMISCLTFVALVLAVRGTNLLRRYIAHRLAKRLQGFLGQDAAPCFTTDDLGEVSYQNDAARSRFSAPNGSTLVAALQDHFASPASVLYRLQNRAGLNGAAREDVVTRRGHIRLSVHRLTEARFLWRLEEFQDRSNSSGRGAEGLSLPMLTANKAGVVLFTNDAMRRLLGGRPKRLDRIFTTAVLHSGEVVGVSTADGSVQAILAELGSGTERREIFLLPLDPGPPRNGELADFESVPVGLLKFDANGELRSANAVARSLLELGEDSKAMAHELFEGLGRPITDWLADVIAERLPGGTEVVHARQGSSERFLQITLTRIVDTGRPAVLAVLQDATALKTLEAQFVQSQKMQAIGQLAGGVAHDFNNLLTAISGHCDLLLTRYDESDPEYPDLIQIHQNSNRAAALVNQLLAFSRKQTLKPEQIDLQDVLSDLVHLLNRLVGERVRLQVTHAADLRQIRADKRQLEQVLMNLVVNARDAMPEGGVIKVQTAAVTLTEDLHRDRAVVPAGDYALIQVIDSGIGIAPDCLTKIFEPFYTTKSSGEGTGLGLSTAYGIVKQSGGFIFVDSTEGSGSNFQLYFPVHAARFGSNPVAISPGIVVQETARRGEGVVLLVEDEAPVRAFASRALRMRGFTVVEAENAESALKMLEDPKLEVDVFVTDVVMPGMDGPSWVKRALIDRPNVRVIFVSGYSEEALVEEQARIPNSIFLPKPFSLNELTKTVLQQCH
ncbi:MAG: ATP-binding protein [Cypionkella sp.]